MDLSTKRLSLVCLLKDGSFLSKQLKLVRNVPRSLSGAETLHLLAAARPRSYNSDCISFMLSSAVMLHAAALQLFLPRLQDASYLSRLFAARPGAFIQTSAAEALRGDKSRNRRHLRQCGCSSGSDGGLF